MRDCAKVSHDFSGVPAHRAPPRGLQPLQTNSRLGRFTMLLSVHANYIVYPEAYGERIDSFSN